MSRSQRIPEASIWIEQRIAADLSGLTQFHHLSRPHALPRIPLSSTAAQFCQALHFPGSTFCCLIMAGKQAKFISEEHLQEALAYVEQHTQQPLRNSVMLLLSHKAGLRAKEISALQWTMITDGKGNLLDVLELPDSATKGHSGRTIPLHQELYAALMILKNLHHPQPEDPIIRSARNGPMTAASVVNWFWYLYRRLGFFRCSSHSGRRTFITKAARKISEAGGSLRDVQQLVGHANLTTTQRYIEGSDLAKRKLMELI